MVARKGAAERSEGAPVKKKKINGDEGGAVQENRLLELMKQAGLQTG